jgi:hypothetical protein
MNNKKEVPFIIAEILEDKNVGLDFRQAIAKELEIEIPKEKNELQSK